MIGYNCTDIDSGVVSIDARTVALNFTTTTGPVQIQIPTEQIDPLIALLAGLHRDAVASQSEGRMVAFLPVLES